MPLIVSQDSIEKTKGGKPFILKGNPKLFTFQVNDVATPSQWLVYG